MEMLFAPFWMAWFSLWFPVSYKDKPKKVDHTNAKYKVVKKATVEWVYFSNATNKKEARDEAWTAFNIYKPGVRKTQTKIEFDVYENPHRKIDDDGYDVITGIEAK